MENSKSKYVIEFTDIEFQVAQIDSLNNPIQWHGCSKFTNGHFEIKKFDSNTFIVTENNYYQGVYESYHCAIEFVNGIHKAESLKKFQESCANILLFMNEHAHPHRRLVFSQSMVEMFEGIFAIPQIKINI